MNDHRYYGSASGHRATAAFMTRRAATSAMEKVALSDVPQAQLAGEPDRRAVDDALGTADLAVKYYELETGEAFSGGYHTHESQEEVFVILEGTATWDTEAGEAALTVEAGEAIRFAPGEFQHGYNAEDATERVRALALGAPPGMDETVSVFPCSNCGERTKHDVDLWPAERASVSTCRECGREVRVDLDD
jgi:uncharacterized cupin superfamily protein